MTSQVRRYMWWPIMDYDIESCVKECSGSQSSWKMPPFAPLHPLKQIDYVGLFERKMFLLMIDTYSKWLEVQVTNSTTSIATIKLMRKSFASLGIPETVVSDNGATFTSEEFAEFLKKTASDTLDTHHIIRHQTASWRARAVQTFKEGMKCLKLLGSLNTGLIMSIVKVLDYATQFHWIITVESNVGQKTAFTTRSCCLALITRCSQLRTIRNNLMMHTQHRDCFSSRHSICKKLCPRS